MASSCSSTTIRLVRGLSSTTRPLLLNNLISTCRIVVVGAVHHPPVHRSSPTTTAHNSLRLFSARAARRHMYKEQELRNEAKAASVPVIPENNVRIAAPPSCGIVADQYQPLSPLNPANWWALFRSFVGTRFGLFRIRNTIVTFKPKKWVEDEAIPLWNEINSAITKCQLGVLQQSTTDKIWGGLKAELRATEKKLGSKTVKWTGDLKSARFKCARFIQIDQINAKFAQLTVMFDSEQKIDIFDGETRIGGSKAPKRIIEYWVFERALSLESGKWRLCHRFSADESTKTPPPPSSSTSAATAVTGSS